MYKKLLGDANGMVMAPNNNNDKAIRFQTGIFDKYILCRRCDNDLLGRLERYGAIVLNGGSGKNIPIYNRNVTEDGAHLINISNIHYSDFKLFLLSLVWRAHVSQQSFFKDIKIKHHADLIKKMLISQTPCNENDYQVCLIGIRAHSGNMIRIVIPPFIVDSDNTFYAIFFISGFIYMINLMVKQHQNYLMITICQTMEKLPFQYYQLKLEIDF